ncbi:MAG: hypothetical protein K2J71_04795, partial [Oscillospiraceae bacterium]|nr:hypothetical protein [Oscillospiraceae bacterium]
ETSEDIIKESTEEATETSEDIIKESTEEATETSEDIIKESAEEATETSGDIIEESTEEATETSEDIIKESAEEATEISEDIIKKSAEEATETSEDIVKKSAEEATETSKTFVAPATLPVLRTQSSKETIGQADIIFVMDTTGSMSDVIDNVQTNINEFANVLSNEYNVDVNYALIEYRDIEEDGKDSTVGHRYLSSNWFANVDLFRKEVNTLDVDGGGDDPETPLDALEMARNFDWRSGSTQFVVLVTDIYSKNDNTSNIEDMNEMAQLFAKDGIIVSAISSDEMYYNNLVSTTGGVYADIYSDFSNVLITFAEKIGTETRTGGDWILLEDYSVVQLEGDENNIEQQDSDGDGLKDSQELVCKITKDLNPLIQWVLKYKGIPNEYYQGKTTLDVWKFNSNPTKIDTDNDNLDDLRDIQPRKKNYFADEVKKYIMKDIIKMDSVHETDDDFLVITTSIADMLCAVNVNEIANGEGDQLVVQSFFDDWYLYLIDNSSPTFGLFKMREQENDSLTGDNDDPGVTISFISFNIEKLDDVLFNKKSNSDLYNEINRVTRTGNSHNQKLQEYFSDIRSKGSYLIADTYVNKISELSNGTQISFPNNYNNILKDIKQIDQIIQQNPFMDSSTLIVLHNQRIDLNRVPEALRMINEKVENKIYFEDEGYLLIQNKNDLNYFERVSILSAFTADISYNMFAAEVKFHADALVDWKKILPKWYKAAIRADMAIGEEYESGIYDKYYDPNSSLVKEQAKEHGEY